MIYWFKRKYRQIQRVIDFLPLIWKGYDFDYCYAIDLFKKQLERTANHLESDNSFGMDSKHRASRIRTAIRLMDKVYDEEYAHEYMDTIEKLYGKTHYDFVEVKSYKPNGEPIYRMTHRNELAVDDKHQKEIDEVAKQLMLLSKAKQERAHKLLWRFIEHNIQYWWD